MPFNKLLSKFQSKNSRLADEQLNPALNQNSPDYDLLSIGSILLIIFVLLVFNFEYRTPLISGFIFATLSYPVYRWIKNSLSKLNLKKIGINQNISFEGFSASILVFGLSLTLLSIIGITSTQLSREIPILVSAIYEGGKKLNESQFIINIARQLGFYEELTLFKLQDQFNLALSSSLSVENLQKVLNTSQQVLSNLVTQIVYIVIFLLAWFNGLLFGSKWIDTLIKLFPLFNHESTSIKKNLVQGIRNVIYANLLSGFLNMVGVSILCLIFGIPNIVIVAILAFVIGFLPISPSELAYAYPIIYLLYLNPILGIIALIISELYILWQNYIFLPSIVLSGTNGNPLFIITSVITGISIFGIMGFVIGPAIMIFVNTLGAILMNRLYSKQPNIN